MKILIECGLYLERLSWKNQILEGIMIERSEIISIAQVYNTKCGTFTKCLTSKMVGIVVHESRQSTIDKSTIFYKLETC